MVKKALLIGINYNTSTSNLRLRGCINDIINIKTFLQTNCNYSPNNIRILTDNTQLLPTRQNIISSIDWLLSNTKKGDTLFFYYSGHGSFLADTSNDENDGYDETIVPLDFTSTGLLTDDWLFTNLICKIPKDVTLWGFTDCCNSGSMFDLKYKYTSTSKPIRKSINRIYDYRKSEWSDSISLSIENSKDVIGNVYFFSGCKDNELSSDAYIEDTYQGAFTYCLVQILYNNTIPINRTLTRFDNKKLSLKEILKEINCRLDIYGFTQQNCQLSVSKIKDIDRSFDP